MRLRITVPHAPVIYVNMGKSVALTLIFFFWPRHVACRILVPQPGIEPRPTAIKVLSPNHWTAREFLTLIFF